MVEVSVTITAGVGSERHNHDLDYRETLEHCHKRDDGVIELIPYERSYAEQINELMKPYIDQYNDKVDARYKSAWERYNSGQIKTKPRKRDYKHMGYDYYNEHKDDMKKNPITGKEEKVPMFRSLILGIGDKNDREKITEEQAKRIFEKTLQQFQEDFWMFRVLGAAIHLDEEGFYHMHLDYKPTYEYESSRGLDVGVGLDGSLAAMGYQPEQSIINGRDKVPLRFNAMRNQVYYNMEKQMAAEGIRLQYAVSAVKDPGKDSSINQRLEDWRYTQDTVRELQHDKNIALDLIAQDRVSPEGIAAALQVFEDVKNKLDEVKQSPRSRVNKNKVVINHEVLDQLTSFTEEMKNTYAYLIQSREIALHNEDVETQSRIYYQDEYEASERKSKEEQEKNRRIKALLDAKQNEHERLLEYYNSKGITMWNEDGTKKTVLQMALELTYMIATGEQLLTEEQRKRIELAAKREEEAMLKQQASKSLKKPKLDEKSR